jgi:hypothetical protein
MSTRTIAYITFRVAALTAVLRGVTCAYVSQGEVHFSSRTALLIPAGVILWAMTDWLVRRALTRGHEALEAAATDRAALDIAAIAICLVGLIVACDGLREANTAVQKVRGVSAQIDLAVLRRDVPPWPVADITSALVTSLVGLGLIGYARRLAAALLPRLRKAADAPNPPPA